VALQTNQSYFLAGQHPWIRGPMGFVTSPATFEAHWCVLKRKRTAFIAVALETSGLIGREDLIHRRPYTAVRIVTIDAGHRAFRHPVMKRFLELTPDRDVATRALFVDRGGLTRHQTQWAVGMNLVTSGAGHLILGMAALQAANMGRLIQVACQADFVGRERGQLRGIFDIFRRRRFRMFLSGAVARFASLPFPTTLGVRFHLMVGILGEGIVDILVTRLACLRPNSRRWWLARRVY